MSWMWCSIFMILETYVDFFSVGFYSLYLIFCREDLDIFSVTSCMIIEVSDLIKWKEYDHLRMLICGKTSQNWHGPVINSNKDIEW